MIKSLSNYYFLDKIAKYNHSSNRDNFKVFDRVNRNSYIRASRVFVVAEAGEVLGEMNLEDALKIARDRELDLIEIAPKATPPVTKIMSWSKYKYELGKKEKEKKKHKGSEQKEMWFKAFIDDGDLGHKLKKVEEFLAKGHPVKLRIRATGRTTYNHMIELMNKILERLAENCEHDGSPKREGRNLSIIIKPKK